MATHSVPTTFAKIFFYSFRNLLISGVQSKQNKIETIWLDRGIDALSNYIEIRNFRCFIGIQ
jgi:hypothetical protein